MDVPHNVWTSPITYHNALRLNFSRALISTQFTHLWTDTK